MPRKRIIHFEQIISSVWQNFPFEQGIEVRVDFHISELSKGLDENMHYTSTSSMIQGTKPDLFNPIATHLK